MQHKFDGYYGKTITAFVSYCFMQLKKYFNLLDKCFVFYFVCFAYIIFFIFDYPVGLVIENATVELEVL